MRNDSVFQFFSQLIALFELTDKMSGNYTIQYRTIYSNKKWEKERMRVRDELVDKNSRSTYGLFVCIDVGFHG